VMIPCDWIGIVTIRIETRNASRQDARET